MEETISIRVTPTKEIYKNEESNFRVYTFVTDEDVELKVNKYGNFSIKGKIMKLNLEQEYNATLVETYDAKNGYSYEIKSIYQDIPSDITKQRTFLSYILTDKQVTNIYKTYPNEDIIALIKEGKFDYSKVKGVGESSYEKIKAKIIENTELHQAIDFLGEYNVTHNMIMKLVTHFNSASLLIQEMQKNPYCITQVSGIGFKKADAIAMSMNFNPNSKHRIISAIEYVVDEESGNGHTYVDVYECIKMVYDLIGVNTELISMNIKDTNKLVVVDDKIALKRNYDAERYIAKRIKELNQGNTGITFDVDQFIQNVEREHDITLTDQQKSFFHNVKKYNFHVLTGFAGCGKSAMVEHLIQLLEQMRVSYKMLSPTGKAAKVLSRYTNREVETIHRAIGLGKRKDDEGYKVIDEEYIIVDEMSMTDVSLCAQLLYKCVHENVKVLFIGDSAQIASVSAGNVLHDLITSKSVPVTMLDIVFRQKEGGILDIATKVRQKQKFIDNDFVGIKKYGNNCVLVSVPQEKMVSGYKHFLNELIKKYNVEDITIVTPTKKGDLGTVEINKHVQSIVNPSDSCKSEKEYGFDKTVFRDGDLIINTKNTYKIKNEHNKHTSIVNGDIGKIENVKLEDENIAIDFDFDSIPIPFNKLNQLLHAWCLTMHKMQGSASKAIIAIADKSHKFQLNNNLLYTAFTRPEEMLIIITQADTLNFAIRKVANLQRRTFLQGMLRGNTVD